MVFTLRRIISFAVRHKYLSMLILVVLIWHLAAAVLTVFERQAVGGDSPYGSFGGSLWAIIVYLTSGLDADPPKTIGGRGVAILALVLGVITVGGLTASIASDLVNRIIYGLNVPVKSRHHILRDHLIIFGWGERTDRIIRELHSEAVLDQKPVVVVSEEERLPLLDPRAYERTWSVCGAATEDGTLERANLTYASGVLVVGDGTRCEEAAAKTLLACLAVKSYAPDVHTCVEVVRQSDRVHFERIAVDELICLEEIDQNMLAQACLTRGVPALFAELLTFQPDGSEAYLVPVPRSWTERRYQFRDAAAALLEQQALAVGIHRADGRSSDGPSGLSVNPPPDRQLQPGDRLLTIADHRPILA